MLFTREVYVVDDEPNLRSAVCRTLRRAGFAVRGYAGAADFLSAYDHKAGILLVDLAMPKIHGEQLVRTVVEKQFNLAVIVLTGHATVQNAIRLGRLGAREIIEKPVDNEVLVAKVKATIISNRSFFSRNLLAQDYRKRIESLTRREHEIFSLVISGLTSAEVGAHLRISRKTVDIHRSNLMKKMGAGSIAELAAEHASNASHAHGRDD